MIYWELTEKDGEYELKLYKSIFGKLFNFRTAHSRQDPKLLHIHPTDKLFDIINEYGKTKQIPDNKRNTETV